MKTNLLPISTLTTWLVAITLCGELQSRGAADGLRIAWTNNILSVRATNMPGEKVDIWYLEAFCRTGSTKRDWRQTTIPHKTELISANHTGTKIRLRTHVEPKVEVLHNIRAKKDEVDFQLTLKNNGNELVDVDWFQPCMRVNRFTGRNQTNYISRCFIFTDDGLTTLEKMPRNEEALYRGGQVYVPEGINLKDVNPRPISQVRPANGLIGCFSADDKYLLATAWDKTQELFQGVIVCIHNDPRIGGLKPGENKKLHGKVYFLKNDPDALLKRYRHDFRAP